MQTCNLLISIDGTEVIAEEIEDENTGEVSPSSEILLADWGDSDVMSVPNLNSIGFAAEEGESAVFTDFALNNPGYGTGVLFDATTGATYSIWGRKRRNHGRGKCDHCKWRRERHFGLCGSVLRFRTVRKNRVFFERRYCICQIVSLRSRGSVILYQWRRGGAGRMVQTGLHGIP